MQRLSQLTMIGMLMISCALLAAPAAVAAQNTANDQSTLTLKQVKQRLKQNKQYLNEAKKRAKAGDAAGLNTALSNYDRGMQGLNTAISQGRIEGSPSQQEDAYNRVQTATSKHLKVLNNLLSKVPQQAVPHIKHAIDVSQTGQQTATSHLSQLQAQQAMRQGTRPGFEQSGGMGRPQGVGRPAGVGGMGAANPPMRGGMGGGMAHPGGGPGMGGGHGH